MSDSQPLLPSIPPNVPRSGSALGRAFGRGLLRLGGWRVVGKFPDLPKLVIIAVPHSSAWDAYWGLAAKLALGLKVVFMAKREAFIGPLGWLLRWFGGVPIDRRAAGGAAGQMVDRFRSADRMWFALAPEGTRRAVQRWKTGFWHIAHRADVPVLCIYFDYPSKTIGFDQVVALTDDLDADLARIRALYAGRRGKHRDA